MFRLTALGWTFEIQTIKVSSVCLWIKKVGFVSSKSILHTLDREIILERKRNLIYITPMLPTLHWLHLTTRMKLPSWTWCKEISTHLFFAPVKLYTSVYVLWWKHWTAPSSCIHWLFLSLCFFAHTSPCNIWTNPASHLLIFLSSELHTPSSTLSSTTHPTYVSYTEPIYMTVLQGPLPQNLETVP